MTILASLGLILIFMTIYIIGYNQGARKQKREARFQLESLIALVDTIGRVNNDRIPWRGLRENLYRVLKELG